MNPKIIFRALVFTFLLALLVACGDTPELFSSLSASIRVFVQNNAMEAFTVIDGPTVEVGAREYLGNGHSFNSSDSPNLPYNVTFDIRRDARFLARVIYRVHSYPGLLIEQPEVTIIITEESPDVFAASTPDTEYISIVVVQNV